MRKIDAFKYFIQDVFDTTIIYDKKANRDILFFDEYDDAKKIENMIIAKTNNLPLKVKESSLGPHPNIGISYIVYNEDNSYTLHKPHYLPAEFENYIDIFFNEELLLSNERKKIYNLVNNYFLAKGIVVDWEVE